MAELKFDKLLKKAVPIAVGVAATGLLGKKAGKIAGKVQDVINPQD